MSPSSILLLGLLALQSVEAQRLARELLIVDANILTPYRVTLDPADLLVRSDSGEFDVPRAKEGGLDVAFLGVLVPGGETAPKRYAEERIDQMLALVKRSPDLALATSPSDAERGRVGISLAIENGAALEGDLANVRHFYDRGVRLVTLVHSRPNELGDSSYAQERPWRGLSPFGREVVAEMNRLGMLIDVSHIADAAFEQVLETSRAPVIASHSACRHFRPGWERNLSDAMIERLAAKGGVINITFGGSFLSTALAEREQPVWDYVEGQGLSINSVAGREKAREFRRERGIDYATVAEVADHIDHAVALAGIDHVGIGSGFDGSGDSMPDGLKDVSDYAGLIDELLRRDYSREAIEKILGGNVMRVWREVERIAGL